MSPQNALLVERIETLEFGNKFARNEDVRSRAREPPTVKAAMRLSLVSKAYCFQSQIPPELQGQV